MKNSIKRRLLVYLVSFTLLVWGIISLTSYYDTRHQIQELFDAQLVQSARVLLELSDHELHEQMAYMSMAKDAETTLEPVVPIQVHKYEQHLDYQIWIADKKHLAVRTKDAPNTPLTTHEEIFKDYFHDGSRYRVYALSNNDKSIQVQVAGNYDKRNELSSIISIRLLASMGLSLPLLAVLILIGVGKSFAPLEKIAHEMEQKKYDNLSAIDVRDTPSEVRPLINALNHLFSHLEIAFNNISRFTADAAHELRTPLAALKVNAQVAQREKNEDSKNVALEKIVLGTDHATSIVEQLLMLSRLDPESAIIKNEKPDLALLAQEAVAELAPEAIKNKIDVSLNSPPGMIVNGKKGMLYMLVKNLVENAINYTPQHGTIEVNISRNNNTVLLQISDSGPGIPQHELQDVFKRFYRGENSSKIQGTGLGLSIVDRIVEIHHAKIELGKSRLNGLQVNVILSTAKNTSRETPQQNNQAA